MWLFSSMSCHPLRWIVLVSTISREHHIPREDIALTVKMTPPGVSAVSGVKSTTKMPVGWAEVACHAGLFASAFDVAQSGQIWLAEAEGVFGVNPALAQDAKNSSRPQPTASGADWVLP